MSSARQVVLTATEKMLWWRHDRWSWHPVFYNFLASLLEHQRTISYTHLLGKLFMWYWSGTESDNSSSSSWSFLPILESKISGQVTCQAYKAIRRSRDAYILKLLHVNIWKLRQFTQNFHPPASAITFSGSYSALICFNRRRFEPYIRSIGVSASARV